MEERNRGTHARNEIMKTRSEEQLRLFSVRLFTESGIGSHEAEMITESLLAANLRGHESHGIGLIPHYLNQLKIGELAGNVDLKILSETGSLLTADAQFGFGQVQSRKMIDSLIPKAKESGIACGTLMNCGHVGRLGEWVERIALEGFAAFMSANDNGVLQCVSPPGGKTPRISTNPIALGVPASDKPVVLDISTSVVANGKVRVKYVAEQSCPEGWLLDSEGNPTTDPSVRFTDPKGTILPFGGDFSFKGFGLGFLFDILTGGLSGGFCPPAPENAPLANNVMIIIWNPDLFAGRSHFLNEADKLIQYVRNTPRREGVEVIQLPGDRSEKTLIQRIKEGIPLDDGTWNRLSHVAEKLNIPVPE